MSLKDATLEGAMLHTAFILSTRGIPQLYYGEEIAMRGGHDPDNRKDFPGGWREDKQSKFTKAGRTAEEQKMFEFVQTWLEIRQKSKAIKYGKTIDLEYSDNFYLIARQFEDETYLIGFNNTSDKEIGTKIDGRTLNFKKNRIICSPNYYSPANSARLSNQGETDWTIQLSFPPKTAIAYKCAESK
jgi:glycosidase